MTVISFTLFVQVCELQRSLKASRVEQQEALERAAAAVTLEQKAVQDSLLQVHTRALINILGFYCTSTSFYPSAVKRWWGIVITPPPTHKQGNVDLGLA